MTHLTKLIRNSSDRAIAQGVSKVIRDNSRLLKTNDIASLYEACYNEFNEINYDVAIPMLTAILMDCGVNPMVHFQSTIPFCYASGIDFTRIVIPSNIEMIEASAFDSCESLEAIVIQDGNYTLYLDSYAFANCTALKEVTLPNRIRAMTDGSFENCTNLRTINYLGTIEEWEKVKGSSYAFDGVPINVIHCIDGDTKLRVIK